MSALALSFNDTQFDIIDRNQHPWLKSGQIAKALGYSDERSINKIFSRNSDEFTDSMTSVVKLTPQGDQARDVRIFSLRGCHLLAMFARTAVAKEFRKWVLDILDKETQRLEPSIITKAEAGLLFNTVNSIAGDDNKMRSAIWKRFQNHFKVNSYKFLPAEKFDEASQYLEQKRIEYRNGLTMLYISDKELQTLISEGVKAKEGEFLPKQESVTNTSLTITLAPLQPGEIMKRWLITHHGNDMVQMWAVKPDTEVKQRDHFIRDLKTDGYLVIKKDEFRIGNFVMEQVPANLLPVLIETAGKRLRAIDR